MDNGGSFTYIEQAIGSATPSVSANSIRLARVSTDTTQISNVQDLRLTSCAQGPFSILKDGVGEASLGDILSLGNGGWENGLSVVSRNSTSVFINSGAAYINGEYRRVTGQLSVDGNVVASAAGGKCHQICRDAEGRGR
jgi:hypothetical protein